MCTDMKETAQRLSCQDILDAQVRIAPYVNHTPLLKSEGLSKILACEAFIKPEMLQNTGSFKLRGAANKVLSLKKEERNRGIICNSSGNHGKACAYMGYKLGMKSVVILPDTVLRTKIEDIQNYGGEVILAGGFYEDRRKLLEEEAAKKGYTHVHPYEDYLIMAGQGTAGMEIMEDLPEVDTIIAPIGGGGLISGIATAAKTICSSVKIIGVQPELSAAYVASRRAGHPVEVGCPPTLGDALAQRFPGENPYPIIDELVDELYAVSEEAIADATRLVAKETHLIAEPSSCVGIAAILSGLYQPEKEEKVCFVLTAGNWDVEKLGMIYQNSPID